MRGMDNFFWHITESKYWAFENKEKITVAIPAPVSGLTQWIRASSLLEIIHFKNLQNSSTKNETIS